MNLSYLYSVKRRERFIVGRLLEGNSWKEVLCDFISYIIEIASGKAVNHEKHHFREMAIWKTGVTL
ncbi:UxaA family hydrolase [Anoxybacteroides rupiense]|uniref:UxaA family hydrolase n=1 Tax=Anoxybacteroides rupiense TaxID=311460 RepID=UPI001606B8FC